MLCIISDGYVMDRESVNIGIRSVLNSSRDPLTINELWQDYIKITGSPVPLRELGYRSLHDYLRSIPDKVSVRYLIDNSLIFYSVYFMYSFLFS